MINGPHCDQSIFVTLTLHCQVIGARKHWIIISFFWLVQSSFPTASTHSLLLLGYSCPTDIRCAWVAKKPIQPCSWPIHFPLSHQKWRRRTFCGSLFTRQPLILFATPQKDSGQWNQQMCCGDFQMYNILLKCPAGMRTHNSCCVMRPVTHDFDNSLSLSIPVPVLCFHRMCKKA